ncbi:MAG: RNA polymerase sigma factor [Solirubrobacteraceae bacterium]
MSSPEAGELEDLLRRLAPQVLGALVRRHGQFDACEDAVQEALIAAARQWPSDGLPDHPRGWLIAVATRRLVDELRAERSRRTREDVVADREERSGPAVGDAAMSARDDALILLFMCCHPALTSASQIALTLRAVGGLSTAEIASAFLVPEATMAQRISRAKQTIKASEMGFELPPDDDRPERLRAVRHVLYLVFNEGYMATAGPDLQRVELAEEAIRITRMLHAMMPADGETTGLLALMLLTHSRRAARVAPDGALIALADQDRSRWDRQSIDHGVALVERALATAAIGPYQLQAAIAALHAEARSAEETDWHQILGLYTLLVRIAPNPVFALNRAVAVAMAKGPDAGLAELAAVESDDRMAGHHRVSAVRAHMLELAGDRDAAAAAYRAAARLTTSLPERRYLESRAAAMQTIEADVETPAPAPTP